MNDRVELTEYTGFDTPLEAVVSGQFELCVPMGGFRDDQRACDPLPPYDWNRAFIRNGCFSMPDGKWSRVVAFPVSKDEAEAIRKHRCVVSGQKGSLHHFHTRAFCVKPEVLIADEPVLTGKDVSF